MWLHEVHTVDVFLSACDVIVLVPEERSGVPEIMDEGEVGKHEQKQNCQALFTVLLKERRESHAAQCTQTEQSAKASLHIVNADSLCIGRYVNIDKMAYLCYNDVIYEFSLSTRFYGW